MAAILPPIPKYVFAVFEPISLVAGFISAVSNPALFTSSQIPRASPETPLSPHGLMTVLQLGSLYLLMAFVAIAIFYTTTEVKVVRAYVFALLLGDIGHLGMTYYVLGFDQFADIRGWNAMAWGNIGITMGLFITRTSYLLGLLGKDTPVRQRQIPKGKKR
ncbi:MAG: hypothetical protein M1833_000736 [Piccolia ochrophora]|nr:MAG: hypothetical protein M1833_000736 [Piccolia ochrophora]